ncbi:DnaJ-like protein [Smittium mucronatum]|uniref:DnaJ-like protein n=1 Tax=Smittium mucronatum TaxID=133383 RepID=A0A1R0GMN3_9FUNG|nr:DnaJ-like protein [Smittium mucronatum]
MFKRRTENYYQILKLPTNSSKKEIKAQFYKLSLKCHPDMIKRKFPLTSNENIEEVSQQDQNIEASKREFLRISEAYKTLSNEKLRRDYDRKIGVRNLNSQINFNQYHRVHPQRSHHQNNMHDSSNSFNNNWKRDDSSQFNFYKAYKNPNFYSSGAQNGPQTSSFRDFGNSRNGNSNLNSQTINHMKNNFNNPGFFGDFRNGKASNTGNKPDFKDNSNQNNSDQKYHLNDNQTDFKEYVDHYSTFAVSFTVVGIVAFIGFRVSALF